MFNRMLRIIKPEGQNLTTVYLYALTSIALLALAFNAIKFSLYSQQDTAIQAIRQVERQTIRTDRLYSRLLDLQLSSGWKSRRQNLIEARNAGRQFFQAKRNIAKLSVFKNYCQQVPCKANDLKNLTSLKNPDLKVSTEWTEDSLSEVKNYRTLLEGMNQFLDTTTNKINSNLIILDISFLGCLLFFLLFQAIFIFKPSVAKLDHALSVRSEFLSRISHEIRNPMNAILGMAEVLKGTRLNMEQRQYLDSLLRAGQTLLEMLNNLIDVSAVEGKKVSLNPTSFDLLEVVDKVSQVVAPGAHHKGIEFFVMVDPKIPRHCRADVGRLEQVLINLLNNAIKFTSKGYVFLQVELATALENKSRVVVSVTDTGIGIDRNKTQDIFNSFVQEDSSIKRQYGGSGLGLTISSEILLLMGSQLKVESEKGSGSRFYFEVDLEHEAGLEASREEKTEILPVILFTNQYEQVMESILEKTVKKHWICTSGDEVLEVINNFQSPVNVIVDDSVGIVNMVSTSENLKQNHRVNTLSALLKTTFPKENIDLVRKSGYSIFIHKPFRPWLLVDVDKNGSSFAVEEQKVETFPATQRHKMNLRVLAVDDSEDNLFLLREILNQLVTKIDFARNGQEAIEEVEKHDYDIIFMDIQMPVMDGYTAIRRIRKLDTKNIPVIAVTAHGGVIDEKRCLEAGFSARLVKPIGSDQIANTLNKFYGDRSDNIKEKSMANVNGINANSPQNANKSNTNTIDPMILKLLPTFFATRDKDLGFMEEALSQKDFDQIKALAHKMKGSSLSYGFETIGNKVKELENAAVQKDFNLCQRLYQEVSDDLEVEKKKHLQDLA